MRLWHWIKNHPAEAMALGVGAALTGGAAAGVLGGGELAGAAGAGAVADATAGGAFAGTADAVGGAYGAGAAGAGAAGGAAGADSALLAAYPAGEDFAAQMAGNTIAGNTIAGGEAGGSALLGGFPAPSSVAGAGAESSLYGPNVAQHPELAIGGNQSTWLSRMDPKKVMTLGMMAASMGGPKQQGGPAIGYQQPAYHPALHSQEEITKAWLMRNDPNTYRRIYGPPPGAA